MVNETTLLNVSFVDPRIISAIKGAGHHVLRTTKRREGYEIGFGSQSGKYYTEIFVKSSEPDEITFRRVKDSIKGLELVIERYDETPSRVDSVASVV